MCLCLIIIFNYFKIYQRLQDYTTFLFIFLSSIYLLLETMPLWIFLYVSLGTNTRVSLGNICRSWVHMQKVFLGYISGCRIPWSNFGQCSIVEDRKNYFKERHIQHSVKCLQNQWRGYRSGLQTSKNDSEQCR